MSDSDDKKQFGEMRTLTMVAVGLLYASALIRIVWSLGALSFAANAGIPMDLFNTLTVSLQASGLIYGAALTVWFWRLWKNSMMLTPQSATMNEGDLVWSTTKAVIWWYVPFVGLVKPYFMFREIWQRTAASDEPGADRPPKSLLFWWIAVVAQTVFLALFSMAINPKHTLDVGPGYIHVLAGMIATIVTVVFGHRFFLRVSQREMDKINSLK